MRQLPHCCVCRRKSKALIRCINCQTHSSIDHLECLEYSRERVKSVIEKRMKDWLCAKCIVCASCGFYIADSGNVQCVSCDRAYHGTCKPPNTFNASFDSTITPFICTECLPQETSPTEKNAHQLSNGNVNCSNSSKIDYSTSTEVMNRSNDDTGENVGVVEVSKNGLSVNYQLELDKNMLQKYNRSRNYQLFVNAKKQLNDEKYFGNSAERPSTPTTNKVDNGTKELWIKYANFEMKTVSESPFSEVSLTNYLFICHFCLSPNTSCERYRIHMQHCVWYHPPGNEIYRDERLSFWEIDGADEGKYCTRLCPTSIMFLASKVAYRNVHDFLFYLLTERTDDGYVLVGYFSKAKRSSANNNLSCLLVFPMAQRAGYGKMLIDLKISNVSGIHSREIVATLRFYGLLRIRNGCYYINVKKVLRLPLSSFRFRAIRDEMLLWKPLNETDSASC